MLNQAYEKLEQNLPSLSRDESTGDENACECTRSGQELRRAWRRVYLLGVVLTASVALNMVLWLKTSRPEIQGNDWSFVGLRRDFTIEIPHDDRTIDDPMWDAPELDHNLGWVALDNDEVEAKGVPTAMHWPWDETKSIYVFHAFHSLHCVFVLRDSIRQYRDGQQQVWPFGHVTHCLHVLREDTTCNADDTPRYTGKLHAQENSTLLFSGIGQTRQCRDWNQLLEYSIGHSACYRRSLEGYEPLLDRYKHCPDGSEPWLDMQGQA